MIVLCRLNVENELEIRQGTLHTQRNQTPRENKVGRVMILVIEKSH